MTALHELSGQYLKLWRDVDNPDFDLDSLEQAIDGIEDELKTKCENVAKYVQNLDSSTDQIELAIKQMQHRQQVLQNKSNRIKKYLFENMRASEISKIDSPWFVLSIKKNPPSVAIDDEDLIPSKFKKEVTTTKIDKVAIKKAGGCSGATISNSLRLDIK